MTQSGISDMTKDHIKAKMWQLDPAQPGRYFRLDEPQGHYISLSAELADDDLLHLFAVTIDETVIHLYVRLGETRPAASK